MAVYLYLMHYVTDETQRLANLGFACVVFTVAMQASPLAAVVCIHLFFRLTPFLGSISKFSSATLFPMSISACSDSDVFTHGTQMFPFESRLLRKSIRYNRRLVFDVNIGMFRFRYLLHATQEFPFEINLNSDNRII